MATLYPARIAWIERASTAAARWVYWEDRDTTKDPVFDGDVLMVASYKGADPGGADDEYIYRCLIRFNGETAPAWTAVGPITYKGSVIAMKLLSYSGHSGDLGGNRLLMGEPSGAWTASSTAAQLAALWGGSAALDSFFMYNVTHDIVQLFGSLELPETMANGIMIETGSRPAWGSHSFVFSTLNAPYILRCYQYEPTSEARSDATTRPVITDAMSLALIAGQTNHLTFNYRVTVKASEIDPTEDDWTLTPARRSCSISRIVRWPETWQGDYPSAGGLQVPTSAIAGHEGAITGRVVETAITVTDETGEEHSVMTQIQVAGDVRKTEDGMTDIELRSPTVAITSAIVDLLSPTSKDDESAPTFDSESLFDALSNLMLNTAGWLYERYHYNSFAQLYGRFQLVWGPATFNDVNPHTEPLSFVLDLLGKLYGICLSQSGDGCIDVWHPAAYSPDRRVIEIPLNKGTSGTSVTEKGTDEQYGAIRVTVPGTPDDYVYDWYPDEMLSAAHPGTFNEDVYEVEIGSDGVLPDSVRYMAALAIARQIAQRVCTVQERISIELGPRGFLLDPGDTLIYDSKARLVLSCDSDTITGQNVVEAVHCPDALGVHSVWRDDGVMGIWRFQAATALANEGHGTGATDGAWTTDLILKPLNSPLYGHWQGPCSQMSLVNDSLLDKTAGVSDYFDMAIIHRGNCTTPSGPSVDWQDAAIGVLLSWENDGDDKAVALFFEKRGDCTENRLRCGYTTDKTAATITWAWAYSLPFGSIGRRDLDAIPEETPLPTAISLEWRNTTIRIYLERHLMLEFTEATLAKDDWDGSTLHYHHATADTYIGCFRHLRQTGWITERQRMQGANGIDPYYGPDTL